MTDETVEIVLVEDNPHDVELALRAFKKHNLMNKVWVLRDGAEALEYFFCEGAYADRENNAYPKVILLDLKLPKLSGIEVLARLKADSRTRHIPVVVLTTSDEDSDIQRCYDLGVNSYIVKPVDFMKFMEVVRNLGMYWYLLNELPQARSSRSQSP